MHFFEFLHPDKSPPNARMPKRLNTLKRKKRQPTHTPHPHHEKAPRNFHECPRSFAKNTIAHSKFRMCIDAKFPHAPICTPKFRNAPKNKVSDYLKRPSKFPPTQQSTPKFHNTLKSKVSDYLKRPSKFPYTHEVREFLTIQRPNAPDQTPTPPKHFGVSDSLQKPHLSRENFTPWGSRPTHRPRHRERAVIRLCACRKMPNTLADANLP